ncbi:Oligo-1,6-glucosidase [metagenome]|uniref:Oligo-1,6-glucosidase n=1 Tax=metagenome TaxID=256318 RepID=A0A2P2CEG3_9ZZZZ
MPAATDSIDVPSRDWWKSAVVYQIYPRTFADSDADGVGDLGGIIGRLDYLQRLGVDVIWLSPVYRSPMDDNGYDISDYQDIDPMFGTLEQFDELVAQAHDRGLKIVMDLVVNHTSDEHDWFVESRSGIESPKRQWYWWRPPREGCVGGEPGAEPTNWQSFFSGPAWQWDEASGAYFLHLFSPKQPDLNWENPEVREAVHSMMRWWLDRGVDGFRMDVISMISKRELVDTDGGDPASAVFHGPRIHEFLAEMHREVFAGRPPGLITVGEMPGTTVEQARLYTDPERGELDMIFQFEHVDLDSGPGGKWDVIPLPLSRLKASLQRWQDGLAEVGWNSLYWGNHDQPRAVSRFGNDSEEHRARSAKALATVLHLHRGTPYIYQGEELAMTNQPFASIHDFRDIESINHYHQAVAAGADPERVLAAMRVKSRDNARTPLPWDEAAAQADDPDSVFTYHRRLIALRHDEPVVARGDFAMLLPDHEQLYVFTRRHDGRELLVVANLSDIDGVRVELADAADWADAELVLANSSPQPGADLTLGAWEARIYRRPVS